MPLAQQEADEINGFLIAAMPINFNFCRTPMEFVFELAHYFRTRECFRISGLVILVQKFV
jgi:hypothetical protein